MGKPLGLKQHRAQLALALAGVLLLSGYAAPSRAVLNISVQAQGSDVVMTASGSLALTALTLATSSPAGTGIAPSDFEAPAALAGAPTGALTDVYAGSITGPSTFGAGSSTIASSGSGGPAGLYGGALPGAGGSAPPFVVVPSGYQSGDPLSASSTFSGLAIADLGAEPGVYTWTWGSGASQDSIVLQIGSTSSIPTLQQWALWLLALGVLLVAQRHWRQPS